MLTWLLLTSLNSWLVDIDWGNHKMKPVAIECEPNIIKRLLIHFHRMNYANGRLLINIRGLYRSFSWGGGGGATCQYLNKSHLEGCEGNF